MDSKPSRIMPSFELTEADLPQIKDWDVGNKYTVTMQVEQISKSKGGMYDFGMEGESNKKISARFRIVSVSAEKKEFKERYADNMSKKEDEK